MKFLQDVSLDLAKECIFFAEILQDLVGIALFLQVSLKILRFVTRFLQELP